MNISLTAHVHQCIELFFRKKWLPHPLFRHIEGENDTVPSTCHFSVHDGEAARFRFNSTVRPHPQGQQHFQSITFPKVAEELTQPCAQSHSTPRFPAYPAEGHNRLCQDICSNYCLSPQALPVLETPVPEDLYSTPQPYCFLYP